MKNCCADHSQSRFCPDCGSAITTSGIDELLRYLKLRIGEPQRRVKHLRSLLEDPRFADQLDEVNLAIQRKQVVVDLWQRRIDSINELLGKK